jgi:hypothetical protein
MKKMVERRTLIAGILQWIVNSQVLAKAEFAFFSRYFPSARGNALPSPVRYSNAVEIPASLQPRFQARRARFFHQTPDFLGGERAVCDGKN